MAVARDAETVKGMKLLAFKPSSEDATERAVEFLEEAIARVRSNGYTFVAVVLANREANESGCSSTPDLSPFAVLGMLHQLTEEFRVAEIDQP